MEKCKFCQKEFENIKKLKGHYSKCKNRKEYLNSILTYDFLYNEYILKNQTANIIAKTLNRLYNLEITAGSLIKRLRKFNIKTKIMSETYTPERIARQNKTNLERYGAINVFCKGTCIRKKFEERWIKEGHINPFTRDDVKEKIKETCLKKYGVEYANQADNVRKKIKGTFFKKYGTDNPMHVKEFYDKCFKNRKVVHFSKPHQKVVQILKEWRNKF